MLLEPNGFLGVVGPGRRPFGSCRRPTPRAAGAATGAEGQPTAQRTPAQDRGGQRRSAAEERVQGRRATRRKTRSRSQAQAQRRDGEDNGFCEHGTSGGLALRGRRCCHSGPGAGGSAAARSSHTRKPCGILDPPNRGHHRGRSSHHSHAQSKPAEAGARKDSTPLGDHAVTANRITDEVVAAPGMSCGLGVIAARLMTARGG